MTTRPSGWWWWREKEKRNPDDLCNWIRKLKTR
jgi:hypothetical protein